MHDRFGRSGAYTQVKFMRNNYGVRHFSFTLAGITVVLTTEAAKAKHQSFRLETVPAAKQSVSSTRAPADRFETSKATVTGTVIAYTKAQGRPNVAVAYANEAAVPL